MKSITEEITELAKEWYKLIGPHHHKDKDCHWYIETKWSYGCPQTYTVLHYGYILDDIQERCNSYEEALNKLKEILKKEIEEFRSYERDY